MKHAFTLIELPVVSFMEIKRRIVLK